MNRKELQAIRERAIKQSEEVKNPRWRDAWLDLANAADRVDAMMARCEMIKEPPVSKLPPPPCDFIQAIDMGFCRFFEWPMDIPEAIRSGASCRLCVHRLKRELGLR